MHWNLSIAFLNTRDIVSMPHLSQRICLRMSWPSLQRQWSLYIDYSYLYYSITLDSIDISILGKGKAPVSINDVETYSKKILDDKIRKLTTTNVQLMTDKIKTEKTKVNLKADKVQLFDKKNFLIIKRKKLRTEIIILNATKLFNILICRYQNPLLKSIQNKFKAKRPSLFDALKENLQKFFIRTRYYQRFYQ